MRQPLGSLVFVTFSLIFQPVTGTAREHDPLLNCSLTGYRIIINDKLQFMSYFSMSSLAKRGSRKNYLNVGKRLGLRRHNEKRGKREPAAQSILQDY